jgi:uncharacterized protein YaiI (UPF0178 family)
MTTLFIDADACPVTREAITAARALGIPVVLVANGTQNMDRYTKRAGVEAIQVSSGADAADFAVIERLQPGDVVVTQDIGLAAMVLGRNAAAVGPRGHIFHQATIDAEMHIRHEEKKLRRAGGRHGGPRPFTDEDREHFSEVIERLLRQAKESS